MQWFSGGLFFKLYAEIKAQLVFVKKKNLRHFQVQKQPAQKQLEHPRKIL